MSDLGLTDTHPPGGTLVPARETPKASQEAQEESSALRRAEDKRLQDNKDSFVLTMDAMARIERDHPKIKKLGDHTTVTQVMIWATTVEPTDNRWQTIWAQVSALEKRLSDTNQKEEIDSPEGDSYATAAQKRVAAERQPVRAWADYTSDSSNDEFDELTSLVDPSQSSTGVLIPDDLESIYPKGYKVIKEACEHMNMPLILDPNNLTKAGFKFKELFSPDVELAKTKYCSLSKDDQAAINTFKALIMFLKLQPSAVVASDPKFAVPASYAMHFLVKSGDASTDERNFKCLKHVDGGRSILEHRLGQCFLTNRLVGGNFLMNLDKIYRAHSRRLIEEELIDNELKQLIISYCFTSPEGMLNAFYVKERRKENRSVEKINAKGKTITVKESVSVHGKRVPTLSIGSDFITLSEKDKLKKYEKRFNLPLLIKNRAKEILVEGNVEDVAIIAERLVEDAYALTSRISSVLRRRKNALRAEIILTPEGKVTPVAWQAGLTKLLNSCEAIPEEVYEEVNRFLVKYET